ncbi:hypothetical protein RI054_10g53960 [Pseudoscourfieldia marina]
MSPHFHLCESAAISDDFMDDSLTDWTLSFYANPSTDAPPEEKCAIFIAPNATLAELRQEIVDNCDDMAADDFVFLTQKKTRIYRKQENKLRLKHTIGVAPASDTPSPSPSPAGGGGGDTVVPVVTQNINVSSSCHSRLVALLLNRDHTKLMTTRRRTVRFNFATLEANPDAVSRTSDYESTPNALLGSFAIRVQEDDMCHVPIPTDDVVDIPSWITQPVEESVFALTYKLFDGPMKYHTDFEKSMHAMVDDDDVYKPIKTKLIEAEKAVEAARAQKYIPPPPPGTGTWYHVEEILDSYDALNGEEKKRIDDNIRKCEQETRDLKLSKHARLEELCPNIHYSSRVASISAHVTADDALELRTRAMLKGNPFDPGSFDFGKPLRRRDTLPTVKTEPGTTSTPREGGGGSMTRLPEIMKSDPGKATELCLNRGGEIVLRGSDEDGHTFVLRLYVVIAAHDPGDEPNNVPISVPGMQASSTMARRQWQETSPVVAFRTFLMGTSGQTTTSRVRRLHGAEMALKTIASQVGALPRWDELARRVENARSHCFGKTLEIPLGTHSFPETSVMVEEYKRFLRIKHKAKDYASTETSPPMEADKITGVKLLDEIWHIHIAMPSYDDDCRAFTGGYVMQHVPALAEEASWRYESVWEHLNSDEAFVTAYEHEESNNPSGSYVRIWPRLAPDASSDGCC